MRHTPHGRPPEPIPDEDLMMGERPLTKRQRQLLNEIQTCVAKGPPPTVRYLCGRMGIKSPNGIMTHLKALERKGSIVRDKRLAGGIRLGLEAMTLQVVSTPVPGGMLLYQIVLVTGNMNLPIGRATTRLDEANTTCRNLAGQFLRRGVNMVVDEGTEQRA